MELNVLGLVNNILAQGSLSVPSALQHLTAYEMFVGCVPKAFERSSHPKPSPCYFPDLEPQLLPCLALRSTSEWTGCSQILAIVVQTVYQTKRHSWEWPDIIQRIPTTPRKRKSFTFAPLERSPGIYMKWGQRADTVKTTAETYPKNSEEFTLTSVSRGTSCVLETQGCQYLLLYSELKEVDEPGLRAQPCLSCVLGQVVDALSLNVFLCKTDYTLLQVTVWIS